MGGFEPVRDLDSIRTFMSGGGPAALFDLPWMPLYLGICYLFHPMIGLTATVGALILVGITFLTEIKVRKPSIEVSSLSARRNSLAEASRRNSEVLHAMGMVGRFAHQWADYGRRYVGAHERAGDITGGMGSFSPRAPHGAAVGRAGGRRLSRDQAAGNGPASSSPAPSCRRGALAPVEQVIAQWRVFVSARQSWHRLNNLLARIPEERDVMELPRPKASLSVETVSVAPPGVNMLVARDIAFGLKAGQGLGIIGPSASGKSSLARTLVGVWRPVTGKVRIDGATLDQWSSEALGEHIGYLPPGHGAVRRHGRPEHCPAGAGA